ncbi:trk system potassium uptake protein TrkA [Catenibacillus scindens]|uniref:Trk system potassium uptake protein TrkA n=1 Tax=Catenibacillus scindens TaxID=673271 RepID=A0A7W8HCW8_9FIRM|nr:TrkA family potassium uptake protein [Catenibacillus scindens]MBB5266014.1 trk system potassium uptake protein TrkA [Catenibacillus scindens]
MKKKNQAAASFGIIGLGRFGMALAVTLANAGKEVIVIDKDEAKVKEMRQYTDYAFVSDNLSMETLKEIGVQNCDVVVVCIGEKIDVSILTTMCVIELGVPRVISKALSNEQGAVLRKLGAEVVYPEKDMALRLGKKLVSNNFLEYISLDNSVEIRQIKIPDKFAGQSIEEIGIRKKYGLNIIAIENGNNTTIEVTPDYRLKYEDIIVVIGKVHNIDNFEKLI